MSVQTLTVFFTDDFRQEILKALKSENEFELVEDVTEIDRIPELLFSLKPDLVLVEMSLSGASEHITLPALHYDENQVVMVGLYREEGDSSLLIGPKGRSVRVTAKNFPSQFVCALLYVIDNSDEDYQGEDQELLSGLLLDDCLTNKELEVLKMLGEGKTSQQISKIMVVSQRTVSFHVSNVLKKMDAPNRTKAVVEAIKKGILKI